ncbi:unnamed protein product [Trichogramma brassicae]|uniref:Uncharacterized protein n=1 Tax=Trichogramma brassicae TaxID=86971 RepID=A0A6H5IM61_9HYME|nr:unnamed protein product [Trichogramma brassicae]
MIHVFSAPMSFKDLRTSCGNLQLVIATALATRDVNFREDSTDASATATRCREASSPRTPPAHRQLPRGVERHHLRELHRRIGNCHAVSRGIISENSTGASAAATRCRVKHRPDHRHGGIATCGSCVTGVLARSNVRASAIFAIAKRGEKESGTRRACHLCH